MTIWLPCGEKAIADNAEPCAQAQQDKIKFKRKRTEKKNAVAMRPEKPSILAYRTQNSEPEADWQMLLCL